MELLIILGVIVGLVLWFRHLRQRELAKFMDADMSAIQTLNKTLESSGREAIDVPDMPVGRAAEAGGHTSLVSIASKPPEPMPPAIFERRSAILDETRRKLLLAIEQTLGPAYRVLAELRLDELVLVKSGAINDLLSRQLSFSICSSESMALVAGVQLYLPPEHSLNALKAVFEQLQCPLIVVSRLDPAGIESVKQALITLKLSRHDMPRAQGDLGSEKRAPECPLCEGPMRQRRVIRVALADSRVWACKDYPTCKGLIR
ncbi:MAG: hypothetical protein ACI9SB_001624 [Candidatus Azotimanducaceae bacterium]|jgi:hypothetical protein